MTRGVGMAVAAAALLAGCSVPEAQTARVLESRDVAARAGAPVGVTMVEVSYGPGESSEPHTHPCPVAGYVVYGAVRMQVEGERPAVYEAGESFYEEAGRVHLISANASRELPARFVAWFTCDGARPQSLVTAWTGAAGEAGS